jgi:hypothetical protein
MSAWVFEAARTKDVWVLFWNEKNKKVRKERKMEKKKRKKQGRLNILLSLPD